MFLEISKTSHPELGHQTSALIEPIQRFLSQALGLGLALIIRRSSFWTRISGLQHQGNCGACWVCRDLCPIDVLGLFEVVPEFS